jgi:flagellin
MSMIVAHNHAAINANKNLYSSNRALNKSLEKLSSGYRINVGADAPADLVISEQLRAQANGLERAVRNTTEAINVLSIAEGALNEMNNILKKMKALAIHAANNGITSPEQVAADQAEMDSGIQTLERIANTTKYSDQFLLNGSKEITYSVSTDVKGTQNNRLVDTGMSTFNQIFKRSGYQVSISYTGAIGANAATAIGDAAMSTQAMKAYLEIDAYDQSISQVDEDGNITQAQSFILTGSLGSRQFNFSAGTHVSTVVSQINNVAGSTGVDASLIFNRLQTINQSVEAAEAGNVGVVNTAGPSYITMYNNYAVDSVTGEKHLAASLASVADGAVIYGKNTDGQGNVYVKIIGNGANAGYELYKDASLSRESLIGSGVGGGNSNQHNNSGLSLTIDLTGDAGYGDVIKLNFGNLALDAATASTSGNAATMFNMDASTAAGVQLGINTNSSGKIFVKTTFDASGNVRISAYNDDTYEEKNLVAQTADWIPAADLAAGNSIVLDEIWNRDHSASTGLGITLNIDAIPDLNSTSETMEIQFLQLGARVSSSEYGSGAFVQVQQFTGGLFVNYDEMSNYDSAKLIDAGGAGVTFRKYGQDATINVNGAQMKTNGLKLNLATADIMADIQFNSGHTGTTTIAQVGYNEGSVFTKATALTMAHSLDESGVAKTDPGSNVGNNTGFTALLNNACHNTNENIKNFQGGMQLQLGEGSGDQERTVIGLKALSTASLGRVRISKQFDPDRAVIETRTLAVKDVMGGQVASLSTDPNSAMTIIEQAISDVAATRATIGAVQSNLLQTNENNLRVAIENITKTESNIRDTDMASEMTEFVKNQVLANAGLSMVTQANNQAQQVMALLQ